jgi:hypothetical protein
MAKGSNLLLDNMRGSIGKFTVVQAADGDSIIKEKISVMYNPRTPAQIVQRQKMSESTEMLKRNLADINSLGIAKDGMKSAYNQLTSHLLRDVLLEVGGEIEWSPKKFQPGLGSEVGPYGLTWSLGNYDAATGEFDVTVARSYDAANPNHEPTDRLILVLTDSGNKDIEVLDLGEMGTDENLVLRGRPKKVTSGSDVDLVESRPKKRSNFRATKYYSHDGAGVFTENPKAAV